MARLRAAGRSILRRTSGSDTGDRTWIARLRYGLASTTGGNTSDPSRHLGRKRRPDLWPERFEKYPNVTISIVTAK